MLFERLDLRDAFPVLRRMEELFVQKEAVAEYGEGWNGLQAPYVYAQFPEADDPSLVPLLIANAARLWVLDRRARPIRLFQADAEGVLDALCHYFNLRQSQDADADGRFSEYYIADKDFTFLLGRDPEGRFLVKGAVAEAATQCWVGFRRMAEKRHLRDGDSD